MPCLDNVLLRFLFYALFLGIAVTSCRTASPLNAISGTALDENGPAPGAVVRVQTTEIYTITGANGEFTLSGLEAADAVTLTAWASGYYIAGVQDVVPGTNGIEIHLEAHADADNSEYAWLPSQHHLGQEEDQGCAKCHSQVGTDLTFTLPVDEWLRDAHSKAAVNPRFLTMYTGADLDGNQSPPTRYSSSRDYGSFPLRPDPSQPYYGPGYKLDFPETAGNCGACHTPAASIDDPYGIDPTAVTGVSAEGVSCDFCHKVWDVRLDNATGLPYPNMPGVLSFEFRRPPEEHQFFAGPYDDVAPGEDTYAPVFTQSQFCAPCHFGLFWDTQVYNSFGEWLESSYSDPENGQTCQDCHMPPTGATHFALPEEGGLERDPDTIFSHLMPGALDEELLQNTVTLDVSAERQGGRVVATVTITNTGAGHHVPTDSPLRHLILLVKVSDARGQPLTLLEGPTLPAWTGEGQVSDGYYAGSPGVAYAKILEEVWTHITPSGAYWNPTQIVSDNRLAALGSDASVYIFGTSDVLETSEVTVEVSLLFRRAFIDLMEQKGWDMPDIVMEREIVRLRD